MGGHRCIRCGNYWASTTNPDLFDFITRFCPLCLPVIATERLDLAGPDRMKPLRPTGRLIQPIGDTSSQARRQSA